MSKDRVSKRGRSKSESKAKGPIGERRASLESEDPANASDGASACDRGPVLVLTAVPPVPPLEAPRPDLVALPLFNRWSMFARAAAALGFSSWLERLEMISVEASSSFSSAKSSATADPNFEERLARTLAFARILRALTLANARDDTSEIAEMGRRARLYLERHTESVRPGALGGDFEATRQRAAEFLRDYVTFHLDPSAEPRNEGPGLVWGIVRTFRIRFPDGQETRDPDLEPIRVDLPPDFDSEARERAAGKAATDVLLSARHPQPEDIVRAILRALGYPPNKAKNLFDIHR